MNIFACIPTSCNGFQPRKNRASQSAMLTQPWLAFWPVWLWCSSSYVLCFDYSAGKCCERNLIVSVYLSSYACVLPRFLPLRAMAFFLLLTLWEFCERLLLEYMTIYRTRISSIVATSTIVRYLRITWGQVRTRLYSFLNWFLSARTHTHISCYIPFLLHMKTFTWGFPWVCIIMNYAAASFIAVPEKWLFIELFTAWPVLRHTIDLSIHFHFYM